MGSYNKYKKSPFETYYTSTDTTATKTDKKALRISSSLPSGIKDLKTKDSTIEVYKMNGKDFDLFDLEINCKSYTNNRDTNTKDIEFDGQSGEAQFSFTLKWTDKATEELGDNKLIPFDNDSKKDIKLTTCFAADWVGFCKYQTSTTISSSIITQESDESDEDYTGATFSSKIQGLDYFPTKAKTWPVNMSVKTPNLFLYIEFKYQHNGAKTRIYVLKYTFDEYNPDAKAGGIYTK